MKTLLIAVGFVGAGLIGAVAGQVLFPVESPARQDPGDLQRLEARFDDLATDVAQLRESVRVASVAAPLSGTSPETHPFASSVPDGDAPVVDSTPPPSDGGNTSPLPAAVSDDVIEGKVRETIAEIAREQRLERARQAEAKQVEKEVAWLESIRQEVGLTDYQVEELLKLMKERRVFVAQNRQKYAEIGAGITQQQREALQQEGADYGRQLDLELRKVLDEGQYEAVMSKARAARQNR